MFLDQFWSVHHRPHLLPGSQFLSPLLQLQAVLLVQFLQLLGLMFDQQVALLVLRHRGRGREAFYSLLSVKVFDHHAQIRSIIRHVAFSSV